MPTKVYNLTGSFYQDSMVCNVSNNLLCFIQCTSDSFECFGSQFTAHNIITSLFECSSLSSCQGNTINVFNSQTVAILCNGVSSCQEMDINIDQTNIVTVECNNSHSCKEMHINISNSANIHIICYIHHSCDGLTVWSDINDIELSMHTFSEDILIFIPSKFNKEYLHCNDQQSYLTLNLDDFTNNNIQKILEPLSLGLFGDGMPCEDIIYSFRSIDRVDCEIRYDYPFTLSNTAIWDLSFLTDFMECYSGIVIRDITDYNCFGTREPTFNPTIDPTINPTIDPTHNPSLSPSNEPTVSPNDPTLRPSNNPTVSNPWLNLLTMQQKNNDT
eukprot:178304_1